MLRKVSRYVEKYQMLSAEDTVAAGISGGADSVCLLLLLSALREEKPFRLLAVHINHKIRSEAGEDAAFVKALCQKLSVPFFLVEEEVEGLAKAEGISTEEAGRKVRYRAFETVLKEQAPQAFAEGRAKIAVAHNLNDRAETMLFHLFRGSGLKGLGSIRPVKKRDDGITIIRPLLGIRRSEIEEYLTKKGTNWCIDRTNDEDTYTRNRIRHHILPFAEEEVCGGAIVNMGRAADILAQTEDFVQKETLKAYTDCATEAHAETAGQVWTESVCKVPQTVSFTIDRFLAYHPLLQKQMLLHSLARLTHSGKDITMTHVEDMLSLFEKEGNRRIYLPYRLIARREYDKVWVEKQTAGDNLQPFSLPVTLPAPGEEPLTVYIPGGQSMEFSVFPYEKTMNIPQNQYTKWFDYGKISIDILPVEWPTAGGTMCEEHGKISIDILPAEWPAAGGTMCEEHGKISIDILQIRTRRTGDYFTFNEALSRKSVQDYMVEAKIPRQKRDTIPLLADGSQILWIPGYRTGTYYKINADTRYVLQVRFRGEQ